MKQEVLKFENMQYMITYPEGYCNGEVYPVLFSIHGAGTRGNNPELLKDCAVLKMSEKIKDFPFVIVSPLCHENTWFDMYETLKRFFFLLRTAVLLIKREFMPQEQAWAVIQYGSLE